jgi:hypothetical protein
MADQLLGAGDVPDAHKAAQSSRWAGHQDFLLWTGAGFGRTMRDMGVPEIAVIVFIGLFLQYWVIRLGVTGAIHDVLAKRDREREQV